MQEHKLKTEDSTKYLEILSGIDLFSGHSPKIIKKLLGKMTQVNLAGGEVLIQEGDFECTAYILIYGRLRVTKKAEENLVDHVLADISPGEMVGEICLLTAQERTATVFAIRDSVLLRLSKNDYDDFVQTNLDVAYQIARTSVLRLIQQTKATLPGENIRTVTIAPAGDSDHIKFAKKLQSILRKNYKCCLVDIETCNKLFEKELAQSNVLSEGNHVLVRWLQTLEDENDFVLFVSDRQMTPWTERCIRESDHVIFVADITTHPSLNSIEMQYFANKLHQYQTSDLIFLHPNVTNKITGTKHWLKDRQVSEFHHIHMNSPRHMEKIVRILTGNSIGIVFNGGGARGFAHLGVLKALYEQQIPIDFVGGSSMGAIIGSSGILFGYEKLMVYASEFGKQYSGDYTFPYISLFSGDRLIKYYKMWYEDTHIEDMWTNFFCVSCNLSKGEVHIHSEGELWKAIRMSTSIPAVFPPVYEGGDMFVDGGIVDNMPVRILRNRMKGGRVIAVNCCSDNQTLTSKTYDTPSISGWKLLVESLLYRKKDDLSYDNIINVILSSINLASISHQQIMAKEADYLIEIDTDKYGLLDFHMFKEIGDLGYETAIKSITEMDILS